MIAGVALGRDAQRGFTPLRHVREIALDVAQLLDHGLCLPTQVLAEPRRDEASARALEKFSADALFEVGELVAERGLREVEMLTRAREVAEL